ncbi:MAG: hypothetical protein HY291_04090 [Planctomycetes bacterium]|nr:hypothetical protein [Planctomycetota bacterium]
MYGWPIATREEVETVSSGGGMSSSKHTAGDAFVVNVAFGVVLVLLAVFVTDWLRERHRYSASGPLTEELRAQLHERKQAFRRRWFGVLRVLLALFAASIGVLILYGCVMGLQWRAEEASSPYAEAVTTVQRKGASSRSVRNGGGMMTAALAIGMLVGTVIIFGAVAMIARRFRLWMALAAVLITGLMGSVPFLYGPQGEPTKALVSFGFESSLSAAQLDAIRGLLDPAAAEKTLPESVRKDLPPRLGLRGVQVDGKAEDGGPGLGVVLEFEPRIDSEARATVFEMYYEYVYQTASRAAKAQGMPMLGGEGSISVGGHTWSKIRKEWIAAQQTELDALFPAGP